METTCNVWRPNILGGFNAIRFNVSNNIGDVLKDGAFTTNIAYKNISVSVGESYGSTLYSFKASDSNSVFAGTTVQASALQALPCIRI